MRLILVEHGSELVRGDSADFAQRSAEWAENSFQKIGVARLAVVAARLYDESEGRTRWNYEYSTFGPLEHGGGYDVFVCAGDVETAAPGRFSNIADVLFHCFYAGFVRCLRPVVSFDVNRRRSALEQTPSNHPGRVAREDVLRSLPASGRKPHS